MSILLKEVTKQYKDGTSYKEVLSQIDMNIPNGTFAIVHGPSGSGKSTLLNILSALVSVSSGELVANEVTLNTLNHKERTKYRRNHIGFIFQQSHLIPYLTVFEQLEYVQAQRDETIIHNLLDELGLKELSSQYTKVLSGGESQRVAIARALINKPEILLADEPTASLDYERAIQVVNTLKDYVHSTGAICIMITHDNRLFNEADIRFEMVEGHLQQVHA